MERQGTIDLKSFKRHNEKCSQQASSIETNQTKINHFFPTKLDLPNFVKTGVTSKLVDLCVNDLRPFHIVKGSGFIEYSQYLINIGAKYGVIDVGSILCDDRTISRNVDVTYSNMNIQLWDLIEEASSLSPFGLCFTYVHWTCKFKQE